MAVEDLRFTPALLSKPMPKGWAIETTLEHFAIVTCRVDPVILQQLLHPRFRPVCLADEHGSRYAVVSVVTRMRFDSRYDGEAERYSVFTVHTRSRWAPGDLVIEDSGKAQPAAVNLESRGEARAVDPSYARLLLPE